MPNVAGHFSGHGLVTGRVTKVTVGVHLAGKGQLSGHVTSVCVKLSGSGLLTARPTPKITGNLSGPGKLTSSVVSTVFTLAGAFGDTSYMSTELAGTICAGNTVVPIAYNNWGIGTISQLEQGAELLDAQLHSTSGPLIAFGHSLGAVCLVYWLQNYGPTSTISSSRLKFYLIGNSVRVYGGFLVQFDYFPGVSLSGVSTPYTVVDFARQYDGWADWPGTNSNYIADDNGLYGQNLIHPNYTGVSLTTPDNQSYAVGNVTYMWSVTWPVPICGSTLQNSYTQSVDEYYRSTIESAYSRPVTMPNPNYATSY